MRRLLVLIAALVMLPVGSMAQEGRSELSLQGTGFFTKDSSGLGTQQRSTETGGFTLGYRYPFNRWLAVESNYGYDRNTQEYFGGFGESRVQAIVHGVTGDLVLKLPLPIKRISTYTYALAGGGGLILDPTGNSGGSVPGASPQGEGAFLYGAGADYALTRGTFLYVLNIEVLCTRVRTSDSVP
jgi:hypothetical protein